MQNALITINIFCGLQFATLFLYDLQNIFPIQYLYGLIHDFYCYIIAIFKNFEDFETGHQKSIQKKCLFIT